MVGGSPLRAVLLDAVSVDESTSQAIDCSLYPYLVLYLKGTGTTSTGVVTIEECDQTRKDLTGETWSSITTLNASDVTGGVQKAYHFPVAAYGFVRARVSTAIGGGGTVTAVLRGIGA